MVGAIIWIIFEMVDHYFALYLHVTRHRVRFFVLYEVVDYFFACRIASPGAL